MAKTTKGQTKSVNSSTTSVNVEVKTRKPLDTVAINARKAFYDARTQKGFETLVIGTTWKVADIGKLTKATQFCIGWLSREDNKGKCFSELDLRKHFRKEAIELGLIKNGKVQSGAVISKTNILQAVKFLYLVDSRLFVPNYTKDGMITIKEEEFIPNLLKAKTE